MRLTEEPYQAAARGVRSPISAGRVTEWLVSEKVALLGGEMWEGEERGRERVCAVRRSPILEFLGQQLSMEEIVTMWETQVDKNPVLDPSLVHSKCPPSPDVLLALIFPNLIVSYNVEFYKFEFSQC